MNEEAKKRGELMVEEAWARVELRRKHSPGTPYDSMNYDAGKATFIWSVLAVGLLVFVCLTGLPSPILAVGGLVVLSALEGHPL